ncbi:MAG: sugar transferase [Deltaproteobacteria bacterium]|nr:sugar transferase [Deltaproteobacteria bacterium]
MDMFLKRIFDLVCSSMLLIVFSPLLLLISAVVWVSSGRPIFFRQERAGFRRLIFKIIKFRTMSFGEVSGKGALITASLDKRVTKLGRILRKYKLDELPQLFNVFLGNMSLVGPRPEVPKFVDMYPDEVRDQVLSVRPGITDIASIEFFNEEKLLLAGENVEKMYAESILPAKLNLAVKYVKTRNMSMDIKLLLKTMLKMVGYYQ